MFPDKCLGFWSKLVDEFTKIVPRTSGSFIGHHQELFACLKSVFLGVFLITLQNYVDAKLGKTEMPMTSNKSKTKRYRRK